MPLLMPLGCYQVKRFTHRLILLVTEKATGCRVPENDGTARICGDDGITHGIYELSEVDFRLHEIA